MSSRELAVDFPVAAGRLCRALFVFAFRPGFHCEGPRRDNRTVLLAASPQRLNAPLDAKYGTAI